MKLFLALFALVASTAADVSHLSREYLPPVQYDHHAHHGGAASTHYGSVGGAGVSVGSSAGVSAGPSDTATYTSQQHSFNYGHQSAVAAAAPAAPAAAEPAASEPVAPAAPVDDGAAAAYGSYDVGDQQQYQFVPEAQQQVDAGDVGGADAGFVGADGASGSGVDGADGAYSGSYDLGTQDAGVQDVADNSLTNSYGHSVGHVGLAAAQGPAIRAPQPAVSHVASHDAVAQYVGGGAAAGADVGGGVSGSFGLDTQYGSNGGYIY